MTAKNDITGDLIATKKTGDSYREGWDRIFGKKEAVKPAPQSKVKKSKSASPPANLAFVLVATEFERGWGQRPDGHVVFYTEDDADAFLKKVMADREKAGSTVPDEYTDYTKAGYKQITDEAMAQVVAHPKGFVWFPRNYKVFP